MNILALDLGTKTGYAYNNGDEFECGTWVLATDKEIRAWGKERLTRREDPRIERLCIKLAVFSDLDAIVFEDVLFASSTYQVQLWSSLRASVWLCGNAKITECVPVQTLKRFATGHGNATKEMMVARYKAITGKTPIDDNAADAFFLWKWAEQNFKRMKK